VDLTRRSLLGGSAGALLSGALACTRGEPAAGAPNVLFISIDDLNDWVSCLGGHPLSQTPIDDLNDWVSCLGGHPLSQTPAIDAVADRGVLFTHAYCASPVCNPSRTAVLTGIRPSTSGVYRNKQVWREALPRAVSLPEHFRNHGYRTVGAGKLFHVVIPRRVKAIARSLPPALTARMLPERFGEWDEWSFRAPDPIPEAHRGGAGFEWAGLDIDDEEMPDFALADATARWLERPPQEPFFLAVGLYMPHVPWFVPRRHFDKFDPAQVPLPMVNPRDLDDVPESARKMALQQLHEWIKKLGIWQEAVAAYLASISFVDVCVARILEGLRASPAADNTIVVLWSDHGFHLGEKRHWSKFALWEESTRVPLVIAAPGLTPSGTRCDRPVSLVDIYPTLVELCGLPPLEQTEGTSLAPLLANPYADWERPALTTHRGDNHSLRSERWRYTRYADGSEELYDHRSDPQEWVNLAGDPELASVRADLARWLPEHVAPFVPRAPDGSEVL